MLLFIQLFWICAVLMKGLLYSVQNFKILRLGLDGNECKFEVLMEFEFCHIFVGRS